jgi:uncharacterized membrane protein YdfJ with MMPL/SSD domain
MDLFYRLKFKLGLWHFSLLYNHRFKVLLVWLLSIGIGGYFASQFFHHTVIEYEPPPGSDGYIAKERFSQYFPDQARQEAAVILVENLASDPVTSEDYLRKFSFYLNDTLHSSPHADLIHHLLGYYFVPDEVVEIAASASKDPRSNFLSTNNASSFVVVNFQTTNKKVVSGEIRKAIQAFNAHNPELSSNYRTHVTGFEAMGNDTQDGVEHDAIRMDVLAVPLALLLFWLFLRNVRMLVIPVLSTLTAAIYSFALMYPIAVYVVKVTTMAPTLMVSMIIAVSTDYVLFMLTRFIEERRYKSVELSVANMLDSVGHVIFVSGATLAVTFASAIMYPSSFLQSFGAGISISVLSSVFVNIFLTPTLLLAFPKFFSPEVSLEKPTLCTRITNFFNLGTNDEYNQEDSLWFKWNKFWNTPKRSILLILLVLAATIPICYFASQMELTIDSMSVFSSDSEAVQTFRRIEKQFPPGIVAPFKILAIPQEGSSIFSQEYFSLIESIGDSLKQKGLIEGSELITISKIGGFSLQPEQVEDLLKSNEPIGVAYKFMTQGLINDAENAAVAVIYAHFDPMSKEAERWIPQVRDILDTTASQANNQFELHLFGGSVVVLDMVVGIQSKFLTMVSVTCGVLLIAAGLVFRSAFLPIRGVFTIGLSVCWTYGLAVIIFQKFRGHPLYWFGPIITFSIIVGLGLDYDIFL